MRALASFVVRETPDITAICEIDPGDALSLATRFELQWAYRGRQALFWNDRFAAREVHDLYLPVRPGRFERRGFVRVDGRCVSRPCTLIATQFSDGRAGRIPELRFARSQVRRTADTILFAHLRDRAIDFEDLGFRDVTADASSDERVYMRGSIHTQVVQATV